MGNDYEIIKEKNPEILQAFKKFKTVDNNLNDVIKEMSDNFTRLELEKYKEEGLDIRYSHLILMRVLKDHVNYIGQFNYQNINNIDITIYNQKTDDIIKAYDVFSENIKDENELKEQTNKPFMIPMFAKYVREYIQTSKKIAEISQDETQHKRLIKTVEMTKYTEYADTPDALYRTFLI